MNRPPLRIAPTTLWEYPSQHYTTADGSRMQGDKAYVGATPSWVIWQLLQRYTREGDLVLDPMCGSGTTLDVCADLGRTGVGFDLVPSRSDIRAADAREIPQGDATVDFVFVDPPYSTHVDYSDDPRCIGKLDASGEDGGTAYYRAMERVIEQIDRVLKPRRYMALYVSDSWRKRRGAAGGGGGVFMPIGFELFDRLRKRFQPVDIICVVRHNASLGKGNWRRAAEEGNFFLRGFSYLFIMKKVPADAKRADAKRANTKRADTKR
jgi:DNA modification methylase